MTKILLDEKNTIFLSIVIFYIKWSIFTQLWSYHVKSFKEGTHMEVEMPTPIYKLIWTVQLLLHNGVFKLGNEICTKQP